MFYCNTCATKRGWPKDTLFKSQGRCETCQTVAYCNSLASSELPIPTENHSVNS